MENTQFDLSVILPIFNEVQNIPLLAEELIPELEKLGKTL